MPEHDSESKVRLRRTKSVTRAEEIQRADYMVRRSQPDRPCHKPRDSLFSWSSGFNNFSGFVNWGFLLLGLGGVRLLLENFIKYGVRVDPREWFLFLCGKNEGGKQYPSLILIASKQGIHNGIRVEDDAFNYQVALWKDCVYICSGVIIDMWHVLTAAHCVSDGIEEQYDVFAGSKSLRSDTGFHHSVRKIHISENFRDLEEIIETEDEIITTTFSMVDVAVLTVTEYHSVPQHFPCKVFVLFQLNSPLSFAINIAAVELPLRDVSYSENRPVCKVAGWGCTECGVFATSQHLLWTNADLLKYEWCACFVRLTEDMICTLHPYRKTTLLPDIIAHGPGMAFHVINLIVMVLMPMVVIHVKDSGFSLIGAMYVCMLYAILFLKLWSYVQVNMWCRVSTKKSTSQNRMRRQSLSYNNLQSSTVHQCSSESEDVLHDANGTTPLVQYPDNLHIGDLIYYILAPTLCYELNFPRTQRIRKRFLVKRIFEVFVGCQVVMSLCQQWMIPSVKNSLIPFTNMDVAKAAERLLKLAIPNHLMWLCFFYLSFHSSLNLMGELLHFADRNFYCDWWNANNIDTFWRTWNMPVHRWAVRHLYIPIVEMGYGKTAASITVFFISAFFHEYLVSVPLRTFKIWAFMGMMGQIPLSAISKYVERHFGPSWGNIVVWSSLIIGQPLCILVYYHDYVVTHFGETLLEDHSIV